MFVAHPDNIALKVFEAVKWQHWFLKNILTENNEGLKLALKYALSSTQSYISALVQ